MIVLVRVMPLSGMYWGFRALDAYEYKSKTSTVPLDYQGATAPDLILRATQLLKAGEDSDEARRLVTRALEVDPSNPDGWYLQGFLAPNVDARVAALKHALALRPSHLGARLALARLKTGQDWTLANL